MPTPRRYARLLAPGALPSGATPLGPVTGGQDLRFSVVLPPSHADQLRTS